MMLVLFAKSHVKAHFKKDGTFVRDYDTKVQKKGDAQKKIVFPKGKPKGDAGPFPGESAPKQPSLFGGYFGFLNSVYGGGSKPQSSFKPQPKAFHPKKDDNGKPMPIYSPSKASAESTWGDAQATAMFTPGSATPAELNGVAFAPWEDHPRTVDGWDYVEGQMDDLDEPGMHVPAGKAPAAGVIIEEPDGRVWVVHPTNGFAGYKSTFPKGHADEGLSLQATAIKECFEEAGLKVQITGYIADVERGSTMTRYYRAKRVGGTPAEMGWETQAVSLVPKGEVPDFVNHAYDKGVAALSGFGESAAPENIDEWDQVGKQAGSNPGGEYADPDGTRWYCKFPANPDIAKNEVLACKLYELAGVRVPDVKLVEQDGDVGVASKMLAGVKKDQEKVTSGKLAGVFSGFAADAWLANWDVAGTGYDNLLVGKDGKAVRIDAGGSLLFRAQGSPKGAAFGDTVGEVKSFLDPKNHWSYSVFKGIPQKDIVAGAKRIAAIPDEQIRALVDEHGPGSKKARAKLAETLIRRKNSLIGQFPVK